jgi:circadian clock protein KaiB
MSAGEERLTLRLFVTRDSPDCAMATANLRALFPSDGSHPVQIEIVDVQQEAARADRDGILVTPTLLKVSPEPRCRVLGNLNNRDALLRLLGLEAAQAGSI